MADPIASIFDGAAIQKQFADLDKELDGLEVRLKTFPTLNLGSQVNSLKELTAQNKAYAESLKGITGSTRAVLDAEKLAAQERKRIAEERAQEAKLAAADLKIQQVEIKKKAIAEKEAAAISKQAAADAVEAGRERILQLRAEQEAADKLAAAERERGQAEEQALSGTFNPGSGATSKPGPDNSTPAKLTINQGDILLVKTYEAEVARLNAEIAKSKAAFNAGTISLAAYQKTTATNTEKVGALRDKISTLNKEIKLSAAVNETERNSLARAQALLSQYTNAKKGLNLATEDGRRLNENYNKAIQKTNEFILKNADAETQRTKNIGNYGSALNKILGPIRTLANILPGLGLSGIFLLGFEALQKLAEITGVFNTKLSQMARQREILEKLNETAEKDAGKEIASLSVLRSAIENTSVPMATRLQAIKNLKTEYPDYFKGISNESLLTGGVAKAYDLAAAAILRKARAQAAEAQITENASKELKILREDLEDFTATNEKLKSSQGKSVVDEFGRNTDISKQSNQLAKEAFRARQKEREEARAAIVADNKFLLSFTDAAAKQTIKIEEAKGAKVLESTKATLDSEFELYKINQKRKIDISKSVVDDDKETFNARLLFLQSYLQDSLELINREQLEEVRKNQEKEAALQANLKKAKGTERNNLLVEIKNTETARRVIEAKGEDERLRLAIEGQKKLSDLQDGEQNASDKRSEERQKEINARLHKILQDFVDRQAEIEDKARKDKEKKDKAAADREVEYQKRKSELIKNLYQEVQSAIFQFLDDGLKRQEQDLDERKRLLDQDTAKRINDINQLGLTEVERVKQTSAIQKEAQFQTEQIEARKRAISVQRAKYEKAASIATIIQSTAEAVVKALAFGPPQGYILAALAGAIGAVQLAKAISTPLPKYKGGRGPGKDEYAIVGDGGVHEFIKRKKGGIEITPSYSSITHLGAEDVVYKDEHALVNAMLNATMRGPGKSGNSAPDAPIWELVEEQRRTTRAVQNMKQSILIKNAPGIETSAWYLKHIKN